MHWPAALHGMGYRLLVAATGQQIKDSRNLTCRAADWHLGVGVCRCQHFVLPFWARVGRAVLTDVWVHVADLSGVQLGLRDSACAAGAEPREDLEQVGDVDQTVCIDVAAILRAGAAEVREHVEEIVDVDSAVAIRVFAATATRGAVAGVGRVPLWVARVGDFTGHAGWARGAVLRGSTKEAAVM